MLLIWHACLTASHQYSGPRLRAARIAAAEAFNLPIFASTLPFLACVWLGEVQCAILCLAYTALTLAVLNMLWLSLFSVFTAECFVIICSTDIAFECDAGKWLCTHFRCSSMTLGIVSNERRGYMRVALE